jgi:hypothetical protein
MSTTVCLAANTLRFPGAGGHLWEYLNWALALHAVGYRVIWLEGIAPNLPAHEARDLVLGLKSRLQPYGLGECVALFSPADEPLSRDVGEGCLDVEEAVEADLLLNLVYDIPPVGRFRRSALVDIHGQRRRGRVPRRRTPPLSTGGEDGRDCQEKLTPMESGTVSFTSFL